MHTKRNSKFIIILLILLCVIIGEILFYFKFLHQKSSINTTPTNLSNPKSLKCNLKAYDNTLDMNITSDFNINFINDDNLQEVVGEINYQFSSKEAYEAVNVSDFNDITTTKIGLNGKLSTDDSKYLIKVNINSLQNVDNELLENYQNIKNYFLNYGYTCNGDTKPQKEEQLPELTSNLIPITEKINAKTNLFEYQNYEWDYNSSFTKTAAFIWLGTVKNISNEPLKYNIHVKLYDNNKTLIGEYQHEKEKQTTFNEDELTWVLQPNASKSISYTIYSTFLNENHNLGDVKYISLEDIYFEEKEE